MLWHPNPKAAAATHRARVAVRESAAARGTRPRAGRAGHLSGLARSGMWSLYATFVQILVILYAHVCCSQCRLIEIPAHEVLCYA
jgi:hypothetical protein